MHARNILRTTNFKQCASAFNKNNGCVFSNSKKATILQATFFTSMLSLNEKTSESATSEPNSAAATESTEKVFSFKASACAIPKNRRKGNTGAISSATTNSEQADAGEDGFFLARKKLADNKEMCRVVGVADGVGGWSEHGVDPSAMSRALMFNAQQYALTKNEKELLNPVDVLDKAYQKILAEKQVKAGSTTACIVTLNQDPNNQERPLLSAANLGDSGFMLLRKVYKSETEYELRPVYRSSEQQVYFNAPYQIGVIPPQFSAGAISHKPSDAQFIRDIPAKEGDIVIVATDGLFDNVFDKDIQSILKKKLEQRQQQGEAAVSEAEFMFECAKEICVFALRIAKTSHARTPFSENANKHGLYYPGGKYDDITAIVGTIEKI